MTEKFRRRFLSAWIKSDLGFAVGDIGRAGLTYREGDREMRVDSELLAVDRLIAVYPASIKRWDPPFSLPVSEADSERIFDNIRRALES